MVRNIVAIVLSLVSGVGGHFVNRRWDRAILFTALFFIWLLSMYGWVLMQLSEITKSTSQDLSFMSTAAVVFIYGNIVFIIISVAITAWDAFKGDDSFDTKLSFSGVFGAVFMTCLMSAFLIYSASLAGMSSFTGNGANTSGTKATSTKHRSSLSYSNFFSIHETYGGFDYEIKNPSMPPLGDSFLNLKFLYDGKPAVGVQFTIKLDGKYETEVIATDDEGMAYLRLPAGKVYINGLHIHGWDNKPESSETFQVTNGHEQDLEFNGFGKYDWQSKGIEVDVVEHMGVESLTFTIGPKLKVDWPAADDKKVQVSHEDGVIHWQPVESAITYRLKIKRIEKEGSTTSYYDVTSKRIDMETYFPLSKINAVKSTKNEQEEYSVELTAYAADGTYLSESVGFGSTGTFVLEGGLMFTDDDITGVDAEPMDSSSYMELRHNKQRLDAIRPLIDDGYYDTALSLLAVVSKEYKIGKQLALRGLIFAKQNQCEAAKVVLKQAKALGDCKCTMDAALKLCGIIL